MWVILRSYVTTGKGKLVLIAIGVHNISKNLRAALELYASWMAWSKFYTEDVNALGTTVLTYVGRATRRRRFMYLWVNYIKERQFSIISHWLLFETSSNGLM